MQHFQNWNNQWTKGNHWNKSGKGKKGKSGGKSPGKGKLTITGNLGKVMKESSTIAMHYIRSYSKEFGIKKEDLDSNDIHIHVPEGATPKDGPSAGITMLTALISLFTNKKVHAPKRG